MKFRASLQDVGTTPQKADEPPTFGHGAVRAELPGGNPDQAKPSPNLPAPVAEDLAQIPDDAKAAVIRAMREAKDMLRNGEITPAEYEKLRRDFVHQISRGEE